jgi:hypothetical protein
MTSAQEITGGELIYSALAEDVPVLISVYKIHGVYRIKFGRGIGWVPTIFKTEKDALARLMNFKTYTKTDAGFAKAICTQNP